MHEPTSHVRQACFILCAVSERRVLKRLPASSASSDEQDGVLLKDRVMHERKYSIFHMINTYTTKGRAGTLGITRGITRGLTHGRRGGKASGDWASSLVEEPRGNTWF